MKNISRIITCLFILSAAMLSCSKANREMIVVDGNFSDGTFKLSQIKINIVQADLDSALYVNDMGYRQIDRNRFDVSNQGEKVKQYHAIVLENPFIKLTLLPKLGKPYSLIYKITGNEQFFIPEIAHIHWSPNKLGWWFMLGGIEYVMPDKEHGDTWATDWKWEITEDSDTKKTVRLKVAEKRHGLKETIDISIVPEKAYYMADINITNPTDSTIHFQHWINPMWAPGGQGELTPNTEFIIPTKEVYVTNRSFNEWMLDYHSDRKRLQPYKKNPIRFFKNWKSMGDLLAWQLEHGYYSAFSHDQNEGIVRVFPLDKNPGSNIWTWGADPRRSLRELFSGDSTNAGYAEMWGGITKSFDKYFSLEAGKSIAWTEWMYPYHGTQGLHYANENFVVTFYKLKEKDKKRNIYQLNFYPAGKLEGIICKIIDKETDKTLMVIDYESAYPKEQLQPYEVKSISNTVELVIMKGKKVIKRITPIRLLSSLP